MISITQEQNFFEKIFDIFILLVTFELQILYTFITLSKYYTPFPNIILIQLAWTRHSLDHR